MPIACTSIPAGSIRSTAAAVRAVFSCVASRNRCRASVLLGFSPPNLEPGLTEEKIGTGLDGGAKTCEKNMKIKSIRR